MVVHSQNPEHTDGSLANIQYDVYVVSDWEWRFVANRVGEWNQRTEWLKNKDLE